MYLLNNIRILFRKNKKCAVETTHKKHIAQLSPNIYLNFHTRHVYAEIEHLCFYKNKNTMPTCG